MVLRYSKWQATQTITHTHTDNCNSESISWYVCINNFSYLSLNTSLFISFYIWQNCCVTSLLILPFRIWKCGHVIKKKPIKMGFEFWKTIPPFPFFLKLNQIFFLEDFNKRWNFKWLCWFQFFVKCKYWRWVQIFLVFRIEEWVLRELRPIAPNLQECIHSLRFSFQSHSPFNQKQNISPHPSLCFNVTLLSLSLSIYLSIFFLSFQ